EGLHVAYVTCILRNLQATYAVARSEGSHPATYATGVGVESLAELAAHLGFLEGDVDEVGGEEDRDGGQQHRPWPDPDRRAQRGDGEAEVHRVAGDPIGAVDDERLVGLRGGVELGSSHPEAGDGPERQDPAREEKGRPDDQVRRPESRRPA